MGLRENLLEETVHDLPLRDAITVSGATLVTTVLERMREKQLGCVFVVDAEGKLQGQFTERTLIDLLLRESVCWETLEVRDCLERECSVVRGAAPIADVLARISDQGVRFVCVTDERDCVTGLTGQKSLSEYIADHYPRQVMVQRLGGKLAPKTREGA